MELPGGPFEVLEILSVNARGVSCRARRVGDPLERVLLVKVLRQEWTTDPRVLARTRDEARLLGRLNHPAIVRVEELVNIGRRPVIVMELVDGVSTRRLLDVCPSGLPVAEAMEIVRRTARALDGAWNGAASDNGRPLRIIHRDVKPEHVLVSVHGEVKLTGFGLARGELSTRETHTVSTILASAGYMAPERFDGTQDQPCVDVYALGLTLIELLSGQRPVISRAPEIHDAELEEHLEGMEVPGLSDVQAASVWDLAKAMCRADPEHRPTAVEVKAGVEILQAELDLPRDILPFSRDVVLPLVRSGAGRAPRTHPAWREVSFLEGGAGEDLEPRNHGVDVDRVDERVRTFLRRRGWEHRGRELRWLLALNPSWRSGPFLDVLKRAMRPWWQVWVPRAKPGEVVLALDMLKHRPDREVRELAEQLSQHREATIRRAAKGVLEATGQLE